MSLVAPATTSHVEASIVARASHVACRSSHQPTCRMSKHRLSPPRRASHAPFPYGETTPALHPMNIMPRSVKKALPTHMQHFLQLSMTLEVIKCKDDATFLCESNGISFTGMDGGEGSRRPSERWLPFLRASWPSRRSALPRPIVPLPPGMAAAKGLAALPDDGSLSYGHLGRADALLSLDESRRSFGRRRKRPKV